jgi:hypothetical protein
VLDDGTPVNPDSHQVTILLPVVIVPGILQDAGGDGTYPGLEAALVQLSEGLLGSSLGEGYRLTRDDAPTYPTLYTLSYDTDHATFAEGATRLGALIDFTVRPKTWAQRVNLVTHSNGGLVARRFLQTLALPDTTVNNVIMCAPPNLGSVWVWLEIVQRRVVQVDWHNLFAVWPWWRRTQDKFFLATQNQELIALNQRTLPGKPVSDITYTIIYSASEPTPITHTVQPPPGVSRVDNGDGVVPAFSALGKVFNPNNRTADPPLIPAFQGVEMDVVEIEGVHLGYVNDYPDVQNEIFRRLVKDLQP